MKNLLNKGLAAIPWRKPRSAIVPTPGPDLHYGVVEPQPLPPNSMTFPNTGYDAITSLPALTPIFREQGYYSPGY